MPEEDIMVIAIGGNAILQPGQSGTVQEQLQNIENSCRPLIDLIRQGYKIVLTHGNGPQVGNALLRSEAAHQAIPAEPLDVCVANTQGSMGYLITQTLGNMMVAEGLPRKIAAVLTQTVVGIDDPAFQHPTKPIGPFYSKQRADEIAAADHVTIREDSGRGYRRLVPSPEPRSIPEKEVIRDLVTAGYVVLAAGGGGVPVTEEGRLLAGVAAVIDKDRTSSLLATEIGAARLIILTGVDDVRLGFGGPDERRIARMSMAQAREYLAAGEFPAGSMGPKIEAAISFLERGGREVIITSMENAVRALTGQVGTVITKELPEDVGSEEEGVNEVKINYRRTLLVGVLLAAMILSGCRGKGVQTADKDYPADTIRIIVHQDAGGAIDFTTRVMAEYAQNKLGVPVVVENVLGASGRIAHAQVFSAKPDGYLLGTANIPTLPMGELAFDGQYKSNDYRFVYGYVDTGHVLAVRNDSPIKDLDDLVQRLKAGRVTISTFGNGSSSHLQMAAFVDYIGALDNAAFVHFEGTAPQLAAQLGGNTDVAITGYGGFSRTEGLRALAVFAAERDQFLDAPTVAELGYDAPIISQIWGIVAPPNTPQEIVDKLSAVFDEAAKDPQTTERFNTIRLSVAEMPAALFQENGAKQYDLVKKYLDLMQE